MEVYSSLSQLEDNTVRLNSPVSKQSESLRVDGMQLEMITAERQCYIHNANLFVVKGTSLCWHSSGDFQQSLLPRIYEDVVKNTNAIPECWKMYHH